MNLAAIPLTLLLIAIGFNATTGTCTVSSTSEPADRWSHWPLHMAPTLPSKAYCPASWSAPLMPNV